jgi:hypothetical protein
VNVPSDESIRSQIADLRKSDKAWSELEHWLCALAAQLRLGESGDGWKGQHGPSGGVGGGGMTIEGDTVPASSVEAAVLTDRRPDEITTQGLLILDMLGQAAASMRAVRNTRERITERQVWAKPAGHIAPECKSQDCEGVAVARGWCDPCRKWISRNPSGDGLDPVTVPAEVIAERTKRRAKAS